MRCRFEWWIRRSSPSAMKARRWWRAGSKRRPSALFMTTWIFSGGTPRAIDSWRSGSWTVISSSATDGGRLRRGGDQRAAAVAGAARRSGRGRTPACPRAGRAGAARRPSFSGMRREARKSGTVATCTRPYRRRRCSRARRQVDHGGEGEVLGDVAGEADEGAVDRQAHDRGRPSVSVAGSPGWRRQMRSTS